ncbi:MAG: hypothetical protein ACXW0Z_21225 [Gemmatirosa sp.]
MRIVLAVVGRPRAGEVDGTPGRAATFAPGLAGCVMVRSIGRAVGAVVVAGGAL